MRCFPASGTIAIQSEAGENRIPVGGIIYGLEESDSQRVLMNSPISILCSDTMFEKLVNGRTAKYYQYLEADAAADADYVTDKQVERVLSGLSSEVFSNRREEMEAWKQEYYTSIGFYGILCGMGCALCLMIFYSMSVSRCKEQEKEHEILIHLGMKKSWQKSKEMAETLLPGILSILLVTFGLSCFYTWQRRKVIETVRFSINPGMSIGMYLILCMIDLAVILLIRKQAGSSSERKG